MDIVFCVLLFLELHCFSCWCNRCCVLQTGAKTSSERIGDHFEVRSSGLHKLDDPPEKRWCWLWIHLFLFSCRFPDNFEKLSPPILQLDEVEFYYSRDQPLFTGLNLSADLESRICIVRIISWWESHLVQELKHLFWTGFAGRLVKMVPVKVPSSNCWWTTWRQSVASDKLTGETAWRPIRLADCE